MTELLTAAQMKAIEQAAIDSGEVTGLELMERAGAGVVEAIFEEWPEFEGRGPAPAPPEYLDKEEKLRAVVLCGPGNNGGDGFVVARLLKERGWEVEVFLYGDVDKLPPDAKVNCERWLELGEVCPVSDSPEVTVLLFQPDTLVFVDALFGTGLARLLSGQIMEIVENLNPDGDLVPERQSFPKFVSVDIASGCCADSGRVMGAIVPSDLTVTFHSAKTGHYLAVGGAWSHKIRTKKFGIEDGHVADVARLMSAPRGGFSSTPYAKPHSHLNKDNTFETWLRRWPGESRHKYSHGHALILSGPPGHSGAARLAARGALRIGAGLATVGCSAKAIPEHAAQLNAVMLEGVEDGDGLSRVLEDRRINALCLGPGLGAARAKELVPVALKSGRKCVLDADGLSIYENNEGELFELCHEGVVMTPHGGEFKRLFPDIAEKLAVEPVKGPAYSKVDATREAAARAGCVVLFKGPDTVIAAPDGRCSINSAHYERAAPWLATAGSGDVLAGFITGLMARGFAPMQAAETAAWLHVECARSFGPGLIAEDLPEELPKVFRQLKV